MSFIQKPVKALRHPDASVSDKLRVVFWRRVMGLGGIVDGLFLAFTPWVTDLGWRGVCRVMDAESIAQCGKDTDAE